MTTQAQKKKGASTPEHRFHNAQGAEVKTRDEAFAAETGVSPEALATSAKLELHNGAAVTWQLEVKYNPNTYPYVVVGGRITGTICGSTWNITGGFMGQTIRLDATNASSGGSCAATLTLIGEYQNPPAYRGTYGFNGATSSFKHTTIYHC
ncbi:hypothetical protein [Streptomyces sp. NBC_01451]|uniref:hypothetical protein n=1 Tax=Streptomyces sp. NBC_01451 TaxID=2903872 RepID=UPI002E35EF52|nr:hypothetical protein [Streptomyces sp. NBC_01451]